MSTAAETALRYERLLSELDELWWELDDVSKTQLEQRLAVDGMLVRMTVQEIASILRNNPGPTLIVKLIRALVKQDPELARQFAAGFGIAV